MFNRIFLFLLVACFATIPLQAKADPFVGQWKLVKLTDQMHVTKVGPNKYAFDFGGGAETIVVDGTQQRGIAGTSLSVAAEGPNWRVIRKKGSHMLLTATWTLSKDGNSLNDHFTSFSQDGSPSTVNDVYQRRAPGSGFAGTWVTQMAQSTAIMLQVRTYDSNGLSFIIPAQGQRFNLNFDGKEHLNARTGSALSARRPNLRTIETVRASKGKITQTRQIKLSSDLKSMTITVHVVGKVEPFIYVFERQ